MNDVRSDARRSANAVRALLLLGVMQAAVIALYLFAARGVPGAIEATTLTISIVYPFLFAALTRRLSLRLISRAGTLLALGCTTAVVAATGGLLSPFFPIFVTIPSSSFSATGAAGVARLGLAAALGILVVAGLDLSGILPAYGIDPNMLPRARIILLIYCLAVMIVVGLGIETARRRSLRQLARAKEEAEAGSHAKSDFLAMISHEVRTPLSGLVGALTLANEETHEAETRERLNLAASCAESLRALLDDILDFSRVEAGRLLMRPQAVAPSTIIRASTSLFLPAAQAKGVDLTTQLGPGTELGVFVDPQRLRQVISNLVDNAIRFTETGDVTVIATVEDAGASRTLRVEVRDTGVGMDDAQLAQLFTPFVQVHERGGGGGTGLGLVMSRSLIEQMGGTLDIESEPGVGTRARLKVSLPATDAPAATGAALTMPGGRPLRVLVAEDTPVLQRVIARRLEREGCTPVFANNGLEAVQACEAELFDLVLMDVHMPELDGLEATRRIRALTAAAAATPVYGLSAGAFASSEEDALKAGMSGYLVKPLRAADLREILATVRRGECTTDGALRSASHNAQTLHTVEPREAEESPAASLLAPLSSAP